MKRILAVVLSTGMLVGASNAVLAHGEDGHGNAEGLAQPVPNTGSISGGPAHRDDPRHSERQQRNPDGSPVHYQGDGHKHGHPLPPR